MKSRLRPHALLLCFCLSIAAQAQTIIRGPYLQNVTPTSIVVRWRTDVPTDSRVRFGDAYTRQLIDGQVTVEHVVSLTGLTPATQYRYLVGTTQRDLSPADASFFFQTAPAAGSNAAVRLWVLGDFGTGSVRQKQAYDSFKAATQNRRPDLWVWLGDNAYSSGFDDEFQRYVFDYYPEHLRNLPFAATPGNHDYAENVNNFNIPYYVLTTNPTRGEAGGAPSGKPSYYSLDYGPVHLVSLDSFGNEDGKHRLWDTTGTQIQWLKRDLASNKRPWTIVFFHHPPYTQGTRNSETEQDLILNRERLTPIFERYNVDLVLCGHSHIYERSYPLRGHRGFAASFNKRTMAVDTSTGRYDGSANSCPIVRQDGSTVYVVNGSGGANTGRAPGYPHPAMVYSYTDEGGSMLIDVADNRLDAQWMSPSGVKDRFTMLKQVNRRQSLSVEYADTLSLAASWRGAVLDNGQPATYTWSTGQTGRSIRPVNQAGTFRVNDGRGCLEDVYTVAVAPRPKLSVALVKTGSATSGMFCPGASLTLTATLESTTKSVGQCDLQLSDASGNFANPTLLGTSARQATYGISLPATLPAGTGYRVRLVSKALTYVESVSSEAFTVLAPATASVVSSATALTGQPASATVTLTGTPPWRGTFSEGTSFTANSSPVVVDLRTDRPGVVSLTAVSNVCGAGQVATNRAATIFLPTAIEPVANALVRVYPNPTSGEVWVEFKQAQPKPVQVRVLSAVGKELQNRRYNHVQAGSRFPLLVEQVGLFFVEISTQDQIVTYKMVRD